MSAEQLTLNNELIRACRLGNIERIEYLLDNGADINGQNERGETPLIKAVEYSWEDTVEYLLNRGADIHQQHGVKKYSAIDVVTRIETVKVLVKAGANIESIFKGMTPLHRAVSNGNKIIAEILLDAGANIEAVVNKDEVIIDHRYSHNTPLMIAVNEYDYDMCAFLISRGANVNYETTQGKTCLIIQCKDVIYKIVNLLIENGADVNHKDIEGRTALMYACMYANSDIYVDFIRLLIKNGADVNIKDENHYDAFDYLTNGIRILKKELKEKLKPFDRINSSFRNEYMDDIIDLLIDKIISDVQAMEEILEKKGMEKLAARTIAIEHFDPRGLSIQSEIREEHRYRNSKKGGKRKSKRSRTRRNKKR